MNRLWTAVLIGVVLVFASLFFPSCKEKISDKEKSAYNKGCVNGVVTAVEMMQLKPKLDPIKEFCNKGAQTLEENKDAAPSPDGNAAGQ